MIDQTEWLKHQEKKRAHEIVEAIDRLIKVRLAWNTEAHVPVQYEGEIELLKRRITDLLSCH